MLITSVTLLYYIRPLIHGDKYSHKFVLGILLGLQRAEYEAFRESSTQLEHELEDEVTRVDKLGESLKKNGDTARKKVQKGRHTSWTSVFT